MIPQVIGLLFCFLCLAGSAAAEDYLVQKGDSPAGISQKKNVSVELLKRANPDQDWDHLKSGDQLTVPDRYVVKAGETLYSLSRRWGVDQSAVQALNALSDVVTLKVGQVLYIPPKPRVPVAVSNTGTDAFWPVEKTPRPEHDKLKSVTFATAGESFRSVTGGTVVYKGEFRGVGRVLLIQNADQAVFAYGNFEDSDLRYGQTVARGQILGTTSSRPSQRLTFFAFKQTEPLDVFTTKR
jgi:LysM repeat protein